MAKSAKTPPNFENALTELEEIVRRMESGDLGLEPALEQYQRGITLVRQCRGALDHAEQRVRELHGDELVDLPCAPASAPD